MSASLQILIDICAISMSVYIALLTRWAIIDYPDTSLLFEGNIIFFKERLLQFSIFGIAIILIFALQGQYIQRRSSLFYLQKIGLLIVSIGILDFATSFLLQNDFSRLWSTLTWLFCPFLIIIGREFSASILRNLHYWNLDAICICDKAGLETLHHLKSQNSLSGYDLSETIMDENLDFDLKKVKSVSTIPAIIIVSYASSRQTYAQKICQKFLKGGHQVLLLPTFSDLPIFNAHIEPIFGEHLFLMQLKNPYNNFWRRVGKRIVDVVCSLALLLIFFPIMMVACIWVFLVDQGSILHRQKRVGYMGKRFTCYKIRTMTTDASKTLSHWKQIDSDLWYEYQKNKKIKDDPRLLKGAKFLRQYSIDELPQILNILKGDMSLIGPRPILPQEKSDYGVQLQEYYTVSPGLTGLWQVAGRNQTSFKKRVELDMWYIQNCSAWLDIIIILKTIKIVLLGLGERK